MELGPIPVVHGYSAAKELPADFQISSVTDIRAMARSGDGTRSGTRKKTASTPAIESDDLTLAGETQSVEEQPPDTPEGQINLFA
ncbi:MAG TPA: hypothetical protein VHD85_18685 [Terracidiphilus sp.]|jgi:hypothetical protein|nr:hypothetical protein [Terracidiphilus sp.]